MSGASLLWLACVSASLHTSIAEDPSRPVTARVRSTDKRILALLEEGGARSRTFRGLVDAIDQTDGIVYVEFGDCVFGHVNGCLLPFVGAAGGVRYFRILVTSDRARVSHDGLIALIGHELRHAAEVIGDKRVVDLETMDALYRKIGIPISGTRGFETTEALMAGDAVLAELSAARPR